MIIGHQKILNHLLNSFKKNSLSHAYIFHGSSQLGKRTLAFELVKKIYCEKESDTKGACTNCMRIANNTFPDVISVGPEDGSYEIGIRTIREVRNKLTLGSHDGGITIVLVNDSERLTREATAALLKTLEEPRGETLFILITKNLDALPETIISRSHTIPFLSVPSYEIKAHLMRTRGLSEPEARDYARYSFGKPGLAIEMAEAKYEHPVLKHIVEFQQVIGGTYKDRFSFVERLLKTEERAVASLEAWMILLRDFMMKEAGCEDLAVYSSGKRVQKSPLTSSALVLLLKRIQKTRRLLASTNINPKLALEALLLQF